MCQCNPNARTPWCGKPGCQPPPVRLQDGLAPEWTCQTCGADSLTCPCSKIGVIDQPAPIPHVGSCIQDLVISDILARKAVGLDRYGTLLQAFNGRDALLDAYQEALDLCQYLRQEIEERRIREAAATADAR